MATTVGYSLSNSATSVLFPDLKRTKKQFDYAPVITPTSSYPLGPEIMIVRGCCRVSRVIIEEVSTPVLQHINKTRDGAKH